jgi:hypothetical protein
MLLGNARDFTDLARGAPQRSRFLREVGDAGQLRGAGTGGGGAETSEGGGQQPSHHRHGEAAPRRSVGRSIASSLRRMLSAFFPLALASLPLPAHLFLSCPSPLLVLTLVGVGIWSLTKVWAPVLVNIPDWYHES